MILHNYITQINKRFQTGISKEHGYRTDLENLLRSLAPGVEVTNEPVHVTDCGNPDFVITKGKIPIGYIEVKDIGKDLNSNQFKEQFTRYRKALDNLIISDYLWFQFFQNDKCVQEIRIGEVRKGRVVPLPENFEMFTNRITEFCTFIGQTIKSASRLAELMASKARLLQNILESAVTSDEQTEENTALKAQLKAFRQMLIHDITPGEFADIYAQTLAYGMFAARLHDPTLEDFSRQEAAELIPKSNPFLRKLFQYIAGYDIDERIKSTVDNLADVFRAANVREIMQTFGQSSGQSDPVIHFYETFLAKYDPQLRKMRGVWYTPEPVVNFIVRAVDDILKTEFGLSQGLADHSKIKIKMDSQEFDSRTKSGYKQVEKEVHRVQILDPACGTGTFLAEVVKHIYHTRFKGMQGVWSKYVEDELIPRLNGFELLMASYAMAHLKLELLLMETGYHPQKNQRFRIFLTNSLEEHHPDTGTLFTSWLSDEANEANHVKRDTPVMVVLGNPPYAVSSSNKGKWIHNLIGDYKKDLNEKNIQPLSDDYIKFIRFGQYFIDKTGEGILAYISNNSFIDGITHRQMRNHLLESFDKVYILDLHGNAKKKETAMDGGKDENVFDIMQGVSINIFVKKSMSR
jgi:predicted helicase